MKIKKNENKNNQIKIKDIEIIKHNKDNSRPNEKFIKLKNDNNIKNIEDYDSDNNVFQQFCLPILPESFLRMYHSLLLRKILPF